MASKQNKPQEAIIPNPVESGDFNPLAPKVTYRGAEAVLGGTDTKRPYFSFSETGAARPNWFNAPYYRPPTAIYSPKQGVTTAETALDEEKTKQYIQDVTDLYGFINPRLREDKRRNAMFVQIYNELSSIPGYIGQGAADIGISAYDGILSLNTNAKEKAWNEYISKFDEGDKDVESLQVALINAANKGFNPLYMDVNKLTGINGEPLSDKSKEIFQEYRKLLLTRQDDAYRQKALEIFGEMEAPAIGAQIASGGLLPGKIGKDIEGDKNTVGHMLVQLAARDVAGSVAVAWATGQTFRSLGAAGKVLTKLNKINQIKKLSSAKVAARYANQIFSTAAFAGQEAVVASPIFLSQYNSIRNLGLMQGLDYGTASAIGFIAGAAEGGLEFAGFKAFKRLYSRNGRVWNMIMSDVIPESLQESSQQIAENIITETTGLTDKTFSDIMYEVGLSALAGGIGGGMFNVGVKQTGARLTAIGDWSNKKLAKFSKEQVKAGLNVVIEEKAKIQSEDVKPQLQTVDNTRTLSEINIQQEPQLQMPTLQSNVELVPLGQTQQQENKLSFDEGTSTALPANNLTQEEIQQNLESEQQEQAQIPTQQETTEQVKAEEHKVEVTPELKQAVDEVYGQYFDLYKELALSKNKKLTEQQLRNGFKAVANNIALARNGVLEESFNNAINNAVAYIPAQDKSVKESAKRINELLKKKGYSAKEAKQMQERLLSTDWAIKHQAQWDMAEDIVSDMFEDAGLKEYATQAYNTLKGLMYDLTFMSPDISITEILENQRFNLQNLQLASLLYDQDLPTEFQSILNRMSYRTNDLNNIKHLVELLDNPKENALQINQMLYGENIDPDLSKTLADINFLASVEERALYNSPFNAKEELISTDYKAMALMRKMGMSQAEIMYQFNLETSDTDAKQYPDEAYDDTVRRLYPEPQDTERILKQFTDEASEIQGLFTTVGEVNKETGEITRKQVGITRGSGKTAVHEFQHYGLTNFMTRIMDSVDRSILPKATSSAAINNIINLQNYLRRQMTTGNKVLTEAQFQETLIDAMQNYYNNRVNPDRELQNLIEKADEGYQKSVGEGIKNSLYGQLSEEKRQNIDKAIASILENNTPSALLVNANNLQDIALGKIDLAGATPQEQLRELYTDITDVLSKAFIPGGDKYMAMAQLYANSGNFMGLLNVAMDVSNAAKEFSFKTLFQNEKDNMANQKPLRGAYGENQTNTFFHQAAVLEYPEDTTVLQDAEEKYQNIKDMNGAEIWQAYLGIANEVKDKITDGVKDITQSISSAAYAVSNTLGSMIEREYYDLGLEMVKVKQEASALKEETDKAFKGKDNLYTQWIMTFCDAGKNTRQKSIQFLRENVSDSAANNFEKMWNRIENIKTQLIGVGLSAEMFMNDDYFPQSVKDYKGLSAFLGTPDVKAETTKLADRLYYNAIREKMAEKNITAERGETLDDVASRILTKEEKQKIYQDMVNKINGWYRENISDSDKVSSFFPRIILQKSVDMMQFYYDPFTTYVKYTESMYRTIMMRRLTGFVNENTQNTQTGRVGRYVATLPRDEVTQKALENFNNRFRNFVRVYRSDPNSVWNYIRQINNITTLGSVVNTINQAMDFVPFMQQFGYDNVIKAMKDSAKGTGIKIQDIGVESSSETFRTAVDNEGLKKIQRFVFKTTKFENIDIYMKNTGVNAAKNFFQEALNLDKSNPKYIDAMRYINECFPANPFIDASSQEELDTLQVAAKSTRDSVIQDLKDGKTTYNTNFVLFHMLGKTQPINPSVTSIAAVAGGPVAKLCMQFTAPMLRQLEWAVDYFRKGIKNHGAKWAAAEMIKFVMFLIAIGLPKEVITNAVRGRGTNVAQASALAPLHIIGVNEYVVGIMKRDGIFQGLASAYRPAFIPEINFTKDLINFVTGKDYKGNLVKNIPIGGDIIYGWFLGGRDQSIRMNNYLLGQPMEENSEDYKQAIRLLRR